VQSLRYGLPVIDTLHTELKLATPEVAGTNSGFGQTAQSRSFVQRWN
jgi:hypothetical protein